MKRSIIGLLVILFTLSCSKENIQSSKPLNAKFEFSVAEQVTVQNYKAEISSDGVSFFEVGTILATQSDEQDYSVMLNLNHYLTGYTSFYARIKSTDIDGKVQYSEVVYKSL